MRAIEDGALPALGGGGPARDRGRATDRSGTRRLLDEPVMKLARPYRRPPLELATLLAAKLVRDARRARTLTGRGSRGRPPRLPQRPGPTGGARGDRRRDPRRPRRVGHVEPISTRRVNVEFVSANPTGPLHVGNARGAFVGDLLSRVLEAGGNASRASTTSTTPAGRSPTSAPRSPRSGGRAVPERRLPRRVRRGPGAPSSRTTSGPMRPAGRRYGRIIGAWAAERIRAGIEASLARPRRPLRRLDDRGVAAR